MNIYLLNIGIIVVSYFLWTRFCGKERGNKYFCIQATIQWILISGLRSVQVGADTGRYKIMFEDTMNISWFQIIDSMLRIFRENATAKDPGYYLITKIFQVFSTDYTMFLLFVAAIFMIPFGRWVYKNSKDPLLSFVIFSCLFYSFFAITGTRQTIVTGIIVFLGTELLKKKQYWAFYLILFLLFPVHKSVIAFAAFPFFYKRKISDLTLLLWTGAIGLAWIFKNELMGVLSGILGYDQYDELFEGAGATTFTTLFMAVLLIGVLLRKIVITKHPESTEAYNAMFIAAALLPLVSINQSAMRGVQYFSIYLVLFIPWLLTALKAEQRRLVSIAGMGLLVLLLVRNNPVYTFFWQI